MVDSFLCKMLISSARNLSSICGGFLWNFLIKWKIYENMNEEKAQNMSTLIRLHKHSILSATSKLKYNSFLKIVFLLSIRSCFRHFFYKVNMIQFLGWILYILNQISICNRKCKMIHGKGGGGGGITKSFIKNQFAFYSTSITRSDHSSETGREILSAGHHQNHQTHQTRPDTILTLS